MGNRYGTKAGVAVGEETAYGTANADTTFLGVISTDLGRQIGKRDTEVIPTNDSPIPSALVCDTDESGGQIVIPLSFRGFGKWLKHLLGAVSTAADTPVSGVHQHTFTAEILETTGLTITQCKGTERASPPNYIREIFEGCLLSRMGISLQNQGEARVTLDVIAETAQTRTSSTTAPTFSTTQLTSIIDKCKSVSATWNSTTYYFDSLDLVIDRQMQRNNKIGDAATARPVPGGAMVVRANGQIDYTEDTTYAAHLAETSSDLVITIEGGQIAATGENFKIVFTLHNAELITYRDPTPGAGLLKAQITWAPKSDATDPGLAVLIQNGDSSATAA